MRSGALPLHPSWTSEEGYVQSLLTFVASSEIFQNLCGGVHVLDFLTREPDLYSTVLPEEWRDWFENIDIHDLLELFLRSDLEQVRQHGMGRVSQDAADAVMPPESLLEYIETIRRHSLIRTFNPQGCASTMPRHIAVGMKPKKIHEVSNFATYVDDLASRISEKLDEPVSLVDFGSGQNYLGRTLAFPPYEKPVIAIERKNHNVEGARSMDVHAKLATKEKIMRNKKEYKRRVNLALQNGLPTPPPEELNYSVEVPEHILTTPPIDTAIAAGKGSITYIEHDIQSGHLESLLASTITTRPTKPAPKDSIETTTTNKPPKVITISLHSCGNLSHHALQSLPLNPSCIAVAIIGCCYNLLTERLGPATYKHPTLRSLHPRLVSTSNACDPHGFPISKTLEQFPVQDSAGKKTGKGVRLNITARMMAVQAPQNWGRDDSENYFTRHFYRALLQRILLDRGVVSMPSSTDDDEHVRAGGSMRDGDSLSRNDDGTPLIVGSLRKSAFLSFQTYCSAALDKLSSDPIHGHLITSAAASLTPSDIADYESTFLPARKKLAVIWSLMAFSAGVVESVIAVDRMLFLKEQDCVAEAWVEVVFGYGLSPRNLCVVGVKKAEYVGKTDASEEVTARGGEEKEKGWGRAEKGKGKE